MHSPALALPPSRRPAPPAATCALALAALLAACTVAPPGEPPEPVRPPAAFSAGGPQAAPDRWWTAFGDARLDRLVDAALADNFELEAVWQRLLEARAVADRAAAPLLPALDGFVDGEVARSDGGDRDRLVLGLAASYEVDLWGRIRAETDAERLRARARLSDYRAAAISLSAAVARTHFGVVEASERVALLDDQIAANERILELIEARVASGQLRAVDLLRQEELLEATREQRIVDAARRRVLRHQLAVLTGRPPQTAEPAPAATLPALPPLPATGLPAELVRRRPDIRRAYEEALAADRDLAAAISDRYPRLDLTASVSTAEDGAEDLFRDWVASFAAGLLAPLFDGGRRRAEVDRTRAARDRLLAGYGQAVLVSFREVEDALVREDAERRRLASLQRQVDLATQASARLRTEYLNGVSDYIDVLTALTDQQRLRRDLVAARLRLVEFRIALYRALAGGFETARERAAEPGPEKPR